MKHQNKNENGKVSFFHINHKASVASFMLLALAISMGCSTESPTGPDIVAPPPSQPVSTPEPALPPPPPPPPPPSGQADLVITNINFSPGSPAPGDEITFWVFIRNMGNAQSGASTLRFKVGGETYPPEYPVPALAPGQEHRYERKVTLNVAQNYLVTATADALDQVAESDEGNNVDTRSFAVAGAPARPDLLIRIINHSPGSPTSGDEITFWVFVRNVGNAGAGASTLRFKVGGESHPPEAPVPALAPGQEYRYERKVTLNVAQSYLATATADALAQVLESDEGNNVRTKSFSVAQ
jgi:subtilase family serine protease